MRVLILCLHRPERSPSQRFRFEQYLPFLESHGFKFTFSYLLGAEDDKVYYSQGRVLEKARIVLASAAKRLVELLTVRRYDLVFVQREGFMLGTDFFESSMARRVPMIYDFDDSIWIRDVSQGNKAFGFLKDPRKIARLIRSARVIFAGSRYLADYARRYNADVEVVPTTIDTDAYHLRSTSSSDEPVCIGWSGSFTTIEHFSTAIPALRRVRDSYGDRVRFKVIGDGSYRCPELGIQGQPWRAQTEVQDLQEIDIGIMPLPATDWARGKCALKGLQYMALGIPSVMSPVGVNAELVDDGVNGFLPDGEEAWVKTIVRLIEDRNLRRRVGLAGRETVVSSYSVNAWRDRYRALFERAASGGGSRESGQRRAEPRQGIKAATADG